MKVAAPYDIHGNLPVRQVRLCVQNSSVGDFAEKSSMNPPSEASNA
ncbi:MAG: hypothetical protein RLN86_08375 [Cyclobacteriaceae bacterium]